MFTGKTLKPLVAQVVQVSCKSIILDINATKFSIKLFTLNSNSIKKSKYFDRDNQNNMLTFSPILDHINIKFIYSINWLPKR